jgi:hypothetical protein
MALDTFTTLVFLAGLLAGLGLAFLADGLRSLRELFSRRRKPGEGPRWPRSPANP